MSCVLSCDTSSLDSDDDVAGNLLLPVIGVIICVFGSSKGRVDGSELIRTFRCNGAGAGNAMDDCTNANNFSSAPRISNRSRTVKVSGHGHGVDG